MKQLGYIIALCCLISACHNSNLSIEDLSSEAIEHNLIQSKQFGPYLIEVRHKTTEMMVMQRLGRAEVSNKEFLEYKPMYDSLLYFDVHIGLVNHRDANLNNVNVSNYKELEQRISYLSYEFEKDVSLNHNGVTTDPVLFHFERNYGVTPFQAFLFAFPKKESAEFLNLELNSQILGLQDVSFLFKRPMQELAINE